MATSIVTTTYPLKKGSPPDFGTLYSGRGLVFDGVGDYINFGSAPLVTFSGEFTFSGWLYFDSFSAENAFIGDAANEDWVKFENATSIRVKINNNTHQTWTHGATFTTGEWQHFAVVKESDRKLTIYRNGVKYTDNIPTAPDATYDPDSLYIGQKANGDYFDGKICNVQMWDSALTEAEVQYSYTHPEKFAYNTSGSSLTASNLVAWYPMIEGEQGTAQIPVRSPQMYIHDGSEKGLVGVERIGAQADREFNGGVNWENASGNNAFAEYEAGGSGAELTVIPDDDGSNRQYATLDDLHLHDMVVGGFYKLSYTLAITSYTKGTLSVGMSDDSYALQDVRTYTTTLSESEQALYFFYDTDCDKIIIDAATSSVFRAVFDNFSLKEVKMGNHGATTFYGDELAAHGGFDTLQEHATNNDSWIDDTLDGSQDIEMTQNTSSSNARTGNNSAILTTEATTGYVSYRKTNFSTNKRYYAEVYLKAGTGSGTATILVGTSARTNNVSPQQQSITADFNTSGWTKIYVEWTASAAEQFLTVKLTNVHDSGAETHYMDDFSIKEVGIATGWASVDSEPLIPQTALMGLSKKHAFDGVNDRVDLGSDKPNNGTGAITISAWIKPDSFGENNKGYVITNGQMLLYVNATNNKLTFSRDNYEELHSANDSITVGSLHHIVVISDSDGDNTNFYINGALSGTANQDATTPVAGSTNTFIGNNNAEDRTFHGIIDEVAIWDTAVLSLAEIQAIFNDGVPLDVSSNSGDYTSSGDLVGYWRNNNFTTAGTWEDLSGEGNHGTMSGFDAGDYALLPQGTTAGKDILGFPLTHVNNGWLNLNGAGYVNIPESTALDIQTNITVEAWIYWTKFGSGTIEQVIYSDSVAGETEGTLLQTRTDTTLRAVHNTGTVYYVLDSGTAISFNTWYHVAMVYSSTASTGISEGLTIYVNGISKGNTTSTSSADRSVGTSKIGKASWTDGRQFEGSIDELKVYNRALSTTELLKNYNHGKSKHS